ncbi:nucleoside deaminase [Saccharopolyspora sp. NPDC050389]|uniref:nucleoside deaminase n=1 Tax=Saccharopolyspora sp. NPDC050389 TaxID=3155516 RepID=UPI0034086E78
MEPDTRLLFMEEALIEARAAGRRGDLAVGAVVVAGKRIVGRGGNEATSSGDPTAHAEVVALRDFARRMPDANSVAATMFTTFEPCPMCLGACLLMRLETVVVGGRRRADDRAWGDYRPELLAVMSAAGGPRLQVRQGPLADECLITRGPARPADPGAEVRR